MNQELSMGRRKKKLAIACELLVYGAVRKLNLNAFLYERRGGIPVEADIVIPSRKIVFLVQHQVFTNQRYPFFNKIDQVFRTKFKSKVKFYGEYIPGRNIRIIGVFFGPMWAPYHLAVFDFFSDGAIECPFTKIFGKESATILDKVDSFAREFVDTRKLFKISKDSTKLDQYYTQFKKELQKVIPEKQIDELTFFIVTKLGNLLRRPLNRNILSMIEFELREKRHVSFEESPFPVDLYDVFFGLVLLGKKIRILKVLYDLNVKGKRKLEEILEKNVSMKDIKLLSKLRIKRNAFFITVENHNVELTPLSYNLINSLNQMDKDTLTVLEKLVDESWSDNLLRTWLLDLHEPERPIQTIELLKTKTKATDFRRFLFSLIEDKKWYAVEVLCKILRINKEEIPQEILKMDASKRWPKRPTPDITNKPESLTSERIRDIIELFEYKGGGLTSLKKKIEDLDYKIFMRRFEYFRRKQLVGKLSSPQRILIEKALKDERIVFSIEKTKLQTETRSLSKYITQKERTILPDRTIFSSVLLPPYKIFIPTRGDHDLYIWCKTDLTGSNEGFVRAKMKISCYKFDQTQKKIVRNRTLPVLVTDFFFGGKKVKEKFIKSGIEVFQLNSVPMLEKFMHFIKKHPILIQKKVV